MFTKDLLCTCIQPPNLRHECVQYDVPENIKK